MKKHFVLIHGAWHGGWCWSEVIAELEQNGHTAEAPTMPGHRANDDRSGITLDDYIGKIVSVLQSKSEPVVLVGHSSAGFLLQSVAARVPEKIEHLIFNNCFILPDGKCQFDVVPPEVAEGMTNAASASSDNCVPVMEDFVRDTLMGGEAAEKQTSLIKQLVPQPIALFTTPINLRGATDPNYNKSVILCTKDVSLPEGAYLGMAQGLGNFKLVKVDLGHEGLYTHPDVIAKGLQDCIQ